MTGGRKGRGGERGRDAVKGMVMVMGSVGRWLRHGQAFLAVLSDQVLGPLRKGRGWGGVVVIEFEAVGWELDDGYERGLVRW